MSFAHILGTMYELCSYYDIIIIIIIIIDNGFIIDELCYIISSMTFIMTPSTGTNTHPTPKVVSYDVCTGRLAPPAGGVSTRSSSDGALNAKLGSILPVVVMYQSHRIQIECGKHVSRPVGTRPDIIVVQLCLIVHTSALLPEISSALLQLWLSLATQL